MSCIVAVSRNAIHGFSKDTALGTRLLAGLGVEGDAHLGRPVQPRSRAALDPSQPNLRQLHLLQCELFDELRAAGFTVGAGQLGENVTTQGIDLLALPQGTRLRLGESALAEVTGLRNPCVQLDKFRPGLMKSLLDHDAAGRLMRKAGVMAIVITGGDVYPGDPIVAELPPPPHRRLEPV